MVIPAALAGPVSRILLRDVGARVAVDGGKVAPGVVGLLWALKAAAEREEAAAGFADETPPAGPVSVEVSAGEWAERAGCSPQYARALARTGRVPARRIGRMWLIPESAAIVAPERKDQAA
ncbi:MULTISPECIES: helix-turn-helix domain-containing protein [unclassified Streptomyces]|uniref:helix-turn-helix domain-containing protein n=1 Tax=unclassified Streptomyces TaxID=2593676 RepID=UPI0027E4EE85|nr:MULTISPECIES: helix-turn-helix domain-containing protein [unclassified Streptomyces]